MKKFGVIGIGTVGKPLHEALKYFHGKVYGYDTKKPSDTIGDILKTDMSFICVPTDLDKNGRLDMSIVDSVLKTLNDNGYKGITVIKSTLRLGYISQAIKKYDKLDMCVFPEWLRADYAFQDTLAPEMTVLGGPRSLCSKALEACCWHDKDKAIIFENPEEAVSVKLIANGIASTKISFANTVGIVCEKYGLDANRVMDALKKDPRVSPRYLTPGRAYGGACLPKDISELAFCIDKPNLFHEVERVNKYMKGK